MGAWDMKAEARVVTCDEIVVTLTRDEARELQNLLYDWQFVVNKAQGKRWNRGQLSFDLYEVLMEARGVDP